MFARLGCFMNGCDFGAVTDGWWGVSFPAGSPAHEHHVGLGLIVADAAASLPVHATQLYAAAFGLVLGMVLWRRSRGDEPRTKGGTFALFLVAYGAFRFLIEFLRDDPGRGALAGLSTSQWISLGLLLVLAPFVAWRWRVIDSSGLA